MYKELEDIVEQRTAELEKSNKILKDEIAASKRTEEALGNFNRLLSNSSVVIYSCEPSGDYSVMYISENVHSIYGYKPEEFMGDPKFWINHIHKDDVIQVLNGLSLLFEAGSYKHEYRFLHKDGSYRWVYDELGFLYDQSGKATGIVGSLIDITDRKKATETLQNNEKILRLTIDAVSDGGWDWNIVTGKVAYSDRWIESLGYSRGEVSDSIDFWKSIVHPDDMPMIQKALTTHFEGKSSFYECENRLRMKSGEYRFNLDRGRVIERDEDGKPLRMVGVDADITERKKMEEELRSFNLDLEDKVAERAQELLLFRKLIDQSNDAIFVIDPPTGNILDVNQKACDNLRFTRKELLNLKVKDFAIDLSTESQWQNNINELRKEGNKFTIGEHRRKDCTIYPVEVNVKYISEHNCEYIVAVARDITERKNAEAKLLNSEKKSHVWLENSPACTKIVDLDFNLQYMSNAGVECLNIEDVSKFYGKPYPLQFYTESFRSNLIEIMEEVKKTGKIIEQETPAIDTSGKALWFHATFVPVNDENGKIDYIIIVSIDISERKRAERELVNSKIKLERKNVILREMLGQLEVEKQQLQEDVLANVNELVFPSISRLKRKGSKIDNKYIDILEKNLENITGGFAKTISSKKFNLSPKEIEVCNMIKEGQRSKEIAGILNIDIRTVETYRNRIRKKFKISNKDVNLIAYLKSIGK